MPWQRATTRSVWTTSELLVGASLAPAPLSLVSWIGVHVMGKKSLAGGLALVVLASSSIVRDLDVPRDLAGEPCARESSRASPWAKALDARTTRVVLEASPEPTVDRVVARESPAATDAALAGVVVDALTGAPIAVATVAIHAPLRGRTARGAATRRPRASRPAS